MKAFHLQSAVEQLAAHLRTEILQGRLSGQMPGVRQLAEAMGTSPNTMLAAVRLLGREGLLESQGQGRRNRIVIPKRLRLPGLRVEILLYERDDVALEFIIGLKYRLSEAGHIARFSAKSLHDLGMDVERVARYAKKIQADAWVVVSGSKPVLAWFATQPAPAMAMFGRLRDVPYLAGVVADKKNALATAIRRLIALGHRRIVMMVREESRVPEPGAIEHLFLTCLQAEGIKTGPYNLPQWEESPMGLYRCLESLFAHTPPTALIFDEVHLFNVARLHLAERGITSPKDVSILCLDHDTGYAWYQPSIAHISWDTTALVRRILKWIDNLARGQKDHRQTFLQAQFIKGGTIGPAPRLPRRLSGRTNENGFNSNH